MSTSHQGIDKHKGEMQPSDRDRAQTAQKTSPDNSASKESTRDRKSDDRPQKSGSSNSHANEQNHQVTEQAGRGRPVGSSEDARCLPFR
jgi:hypothetical protein